MRCSHETAPAISAILLTRDEAHQTLGRDVALKILSDIFARARDRMARFTREAQLTVYPFSRLEIGDGPVVYALW